MVAKIAGNFSIRICKVIDLFILDFGISLFEDIKTPEEYKHIVYQGKDMYESANELTPKQIDIRYCSIEN